MGMMTTFTAVGSGILAGIYAAFAVMVMPALRRGAPQGAAAVMGEINARAERGPFIVLFLAVTGAALVSGVAATQRQSAGEAVVAGAALASSVITVLANVPLNRKLAGRGHRYWGEYVTRWGHWNILRMVAAAAAPIVAVVGRH